MQTLTVHMTRAFSHQPGRGVSLVGHVWFALSDGHATHNYGFHPRAAVEPRSVFDWLTILSTEGRVVDSDARVRPKQAYTCTIPLWPAQYEAILDWAEDRSAHGFGSYHLLSHNCMDFVWEALRQGGVHPHDKPDFDGVLLPMANIAWFENVAAVQRRRLGLGAPELALPESAKVSKETAATSLPRRRRSAMA